MSFQSKQDLISVIVPVFNTEAYLPRCIETIIQQTYTNLEILLIDDGSTDGSGSLCDLYAKRDSRIRVFHQTNQKTWAARNTGQRFAQGEYIMFVDGDDFLDTDAIRIAYTAINGPKQYDLAIFNFLSISRIDESICWKDDHSPALLSDLSQEELFEKLPLLSTVWGKLYRKKVINNVWANNYSFAEDYDYIIQVFLRVNNAVWIHQTMYYYVQRPSSAVHLQDANIIGRQNHMEVLLSRLAVFPLSQKHLRVYLLKDLYTDFLLLIQYAWDTERRDVICRQCKQNEKSFRKEYWREQRISLGEKIATTLNILYPKFLRQMKQLFGKWFSWRMLGAFR